MVRQAHHERNTPLVLSLSKDSTGPTPNFETDSAIKSPGRSFQSRLRRCILGAAILAALAALGCTQGAYPVDIFYEMHYQQSYKSGEPPRLSAPESSVAWYPDPVSTSFTDGQHLYTINCSMCHGSGGLGDGPVVQMLKERYGYKPVIDPPVIIDNPVANIVLVLEAEARFFGPDSVMPPFGKLLSDTERMAIAQYIHTLPGATPATAAEEDISYPALGTTVSTDEETAGPLEIGVIGDSLKFNTSTLEVAAGAEVVIVFNNGSILNQHNLVIVQAGQKDVVAGRGVKAGPSNSWVEPGDPDVITNVSLLDPGETGEVRFTAPSAGTYQFVCTFPGHNPTMFGDFVVSP